MYSQKAHRVRNETEFCPLPLNTVDSVRVQAACGQVDVLQPLSITLALDEWLWLLEGVRRGQDAQMGQLAWMVAGHLEGCVSDECLRQQRLMADSGDTIPN
jgi:hypothetical protein